MDAGDAAGTRSRLLESVPSPDAELAAQILAACPKVDVVADEPYFGSSLPPGTLLIDERGFVVLRVTPALDMTGERFEGTMLARGTR